MDPAANTDGKEIVSGAAARAREAFRRERRLLTFEQYLDLFLADGYALGRSAVQYAADALEHFGAEPASPADPTVRRHRLFDAPFAGGRGAVHGHEAVQEALARILRAGAEEGRLGRLVVLAGPNGSAKSTLVEALFAGLARYSTLREGARYRFAWVFPKGAPGAELGFTASRSREAAADGAGEASHAVLEAADLAARIPCDLRDDPLLLLPPEDRAAALEAAAARRPFRRPLRHLLGGSLCSRCRAVHDALLTAHRGDLAAVLRHVQVERWFLDPIYRSGAVVVPPQQSVDADARVAHASPAGSLPAVLHGIPFVELAGDLVDANRGYLEFADFLKRPVDFSKYLLQATEKGQAPVGPVLARLDIVFLATTNEVYMDAFRASPDWASWKARMELVRVPYLRDPVAEEAVARGFAADLAPGRHLPPHLLRCLAEWAVATRLRRPSGERLPADARAAALSLSPPEKLRLLAGGVVPERLSPDEGRALLAARGAVADEFRDETAYEGRTGASPRELRGVLAGAAADPDAGSCLAPRVVFAHLRALLRDRSLHEFLRVEPDRGYGDAAALADHAEREFARLALEDQREALELVPAGEYERRFDRYLAHAVAFTQGERVRGTHPGEALPPDPEVLGSVERLLKIPVPPEAWRRDLVARLGAFGVENPGRRPDLRALFPEILRALREDYYRTVRDRVREAERHLLAHGTPEFEALEPAARARATRALDVLSTKFGYCATCARDAGAMVVRLLDE